MSEVVNFFSLDGGNNAALEGRLWLNTTTNLKHTSVLPVNWTTFFSQGKDLCTLKETYTQRQQRQQRQITVFCLPNYVYNIIKTIHFIGSIGCWYNGEFLNNTHKHGFKTFF